MLLCVNRCLCHGLGSHVQRACSCRALDRVPVAVACQLPRVASSTACSAPLQRAATRQACTGPYGQHCDRYVHQPPGWSTLPSPVATRPPSPPLESEASEVALCRSYPWRAQSCSRRALTSARPSGRMATPPRGSPADLETLRGRSGRPVCLPGHVPLPAVLLPVRGDPRHGRAGTQLASGPTQNMRFPQWAFSHRPCARSGRTRSRSSWWRRTGPIGLGSQNWCSSRQPLLKQIPLRRDLLSLALWHPRPDLWNPHVWSLDGTRRF